MTKMIDHYMEASEASAETREQFAALVRAVPKLPKKPLNAATRVKRWLHEQGFSYDINSFKVQDVLSKQAGNCLGTPLLMGAILDEREVPFEYELLVSPWDAVWAAENAFVKRYNEELPYDKRNLAAEPVEFPRFRCTPLEHIVLYVGDTRLEVTSPDSDYALAESAQPLKPAQAVSYLFKDRALEEGLAGNVEKAKELIARGLAVWPRNRELHALTATLENGDGNTGAIKAATDAYAALGGSDSLFQFNRFLATGEENFLNQAISQYPAHAQAIAAKAALATPIEAREARFLYGLASHLYANSSVLSLQDFYVNHAPQLSHLFGRQEINSRLRRFLSHQPQAIGAK